MPNVEITLNVGRTPEVKERLAKRISQVFAEEGVCAAEVVSIIYRDVALHDWVIGGVTMENRLRQAAAAKQDKS